jgi:hypothetical protein
LGNPAGGKARSLGVISPSGVTVVQRAGRARRRGDAGGHP